MAKTRVLVVGGTGYLGRRMVQASLREGHETFVLHRPEIGHDVDNISVDMDKLQMLLSFKKQGARLVEASLSDHESLVNAVKQVDVVVCTMSSIHFQSHPILLQQQLVKAIKEAGNIKRFLPSEFGMNPARMQDAIEPGRVTFDEKMVVRRAIEEAQIPFTYVSANCFAGYFVGNLSQLGTLVPPRDKVRLFGQGNVKAVYVNEDDIATYTMKTINDPRTLNKTVYIVPPENVLSQRELVDIWEKLIGKKLQKISIYEKDFIDSMKGMDFAGQVVVGHLYHIYYEGCLVFDLKEDEGEEEASKLYPEVEYTRMDEYLKAYV